MDRAAILLYGASGFTGQLIAREAARSGLRLRLCGRNAAALAQLSAELGYAFDAVTASDEVALSKLLKGTRVLLNAAGPFVQTAQPLMAACLRAGVSYLDLSGELDTLLQASTLHDAAQSRGVMVMPAVGFDVVPSDCLARGLVDLVPETEALHVAVSGLNHLSRGSARTLLGMIGRPVRALRSGTLCPLPSAHRERSIDFGEGQRRVCAVDWADVVSAHFTTGVPDVTTYFEYTLPLSAALSLRHPRASLLRRAALSRWTESVVDAMPDGPGERERAAARCTVHVSAFTRAGAVATARCVTSDVYSFSAESACVLASRAADGDIEPGFQTPARVYGSQLLTELSNRVVKETVWS